MSTAEPTEYDPFEEFNRSAGIGVVEDPYPMFALARPTAPLIQEDVRAMAGLEVEGEDQAGFIDPELFGDIPDVFTAFTFDAVQAVLRDGETFSSKGYEDVMGQVMGHTILEMDEPEHHTYRGHRAAGVQPQDDGALGGRGDHPDRRRAHRRVHRPRHAPSWSASSRSRSRCGVIARLLGLPNEEMPQFHRLAVELISVGFDMDRGLAASQALGDYFGAILADRREQPGRRPDEHARAGRARRSAPHRRRDLRVPPPAAPRRRGDHLPVVGQPAVRPAQRPGAARRAARRPLADAAGDRGGPAVGAAAAHDHPHRDARHRGRGRRRSGRAR